MKLRLWLAVAAVLTVLSVSAARRALVVGVSDYPRHRSVPAMSWSPVHGAEDAAMMDKALRDRGLPSLSLPTRGLRRPEYGVLYGHF